MSKRSRRESFADCQTEFTKLPANTLPTAGVGLDACSLLLSEIPPSSASRDQLDVDLQIRMRRHPKSADAGHSLALNQFAIGLQRGPRNVCDGKMIACAIANKIEGVHRPCPGACGARWVRARTDAAFDWRWVRRDVPHVDPLAVCGGGSGS